MTRAEAGPPKPKPEPVVKVELRREVLSLVREAHVFDGYSGRGVCWAGAWKHATSYTGCDVELYLEDPRRRFVGDVRKVLRAIELSSWNVWDFDGPRAPWEALVILAARRRWGSGERGAIVVTDCTRPPKPRHLPKLAPGVVDLIGLAEAERLAATPRELHTVCLQGWARLAGVRVARTLREERSEPRPRIYSALVFEG